MDYLIVEHNVDLNNKKVVNKQQANLVEALIGAIYLDGGIKPAKNMIINTIWKYREEAWKAINYKGKLKTYNTKDKFSKLKKGIKGGIKKIIIAREKSLNSCA